AAEAAADEISVPAFEIVEETVADEAIPDTSPTVNDDIELLLTPEPAAPEGDAVMATTQDLINHRVAELDDLDAPMPAHVPAVANGSNGSSAAARPARKIPAT